MSGTSRFWSRREKILDPSPGPDQKNFGDGPSQKNLVSVSQGPFYRSLEQAVRKGSSTAIRVYDRFNLTLLNVGSPPSYILEDHDGLNRLV